MRHQNGFVDIEPTILSASCKYVFFFKSALRACAEPLELTWNNCLSQAIVVKNTSLLKTLPSVGKTVAFHSAECEKFAVKLRKNRSLYKNSQWRRVKCTSCLKAMLTPDMQLNCGTNRKKSCKYHEHWKSHIGKIHAIEHLLNIFWTTIEHLFI